MSTHALGLALAAGPERWTAMEGGCPVIADGECIGGIGVAGGDWQHPTSASRRPRSKRSARAGSKSWQTRYASPASAWAGGRTCSPTRSRARASSRSSPVSRAPSRSARLSPRNITARPPQAMRPSSRIKASRRSSIPRRTMCTWKRRARQRPPASTSSSTSRSPIRSRRPQAHRGLPAGRRRPGARLSAPAREPFPLDQAADRGRRVRQDGQCRGQYQPRPARPVRYQFMALHRRGHAGRGDAADRRALRRRARLSHRPDQSGERAIRAIGAAGRQS